MAGDGGRPACVSAMSLRLRPASVRQSGLYPGGRAQLVWSVVESVECSREHGRLSRSAVHSSSPKTPSSTGDYLYTAHYCLRRLVRNYTLHLPVIFVKRGTDLLKLSAGCSSEVMIIRIQSTDNIPSYYFPFSFLFNRIVFQSCSILNRSPKENTWVLAKVFFRPDVLPVVQPKTILTPGPD